MGLTPMQFPAATGALAAQTMVIAIAMRRARMNQSWPNGFACPDEQMRRHCQAVFDGEYALPPGYGLQETERAMQVMDIGANYGAFSWWARTQWPRCDLWCYEPNPETFKVLLENGKSFPCSRDKALTYYADKAVTACGIIGNRLHKGKNNCGESSLIYGDEQLEDSWHVEIEPAVGLPRCDVLKVDTEGMEWPILDAYRYRSDTLVIMLEWHSHRDRWAIGKLLSETHDCVVDRQTMPKRGIMVWVKS